MARDYKRKTQKAKWTREELRKALDAIKSSRKIRDVSRTFGIHEATLRTRIKAKNIEGPKLGRNPRFSIEQENEIKSCYYDGQTVLWHYMHPAGKDSV